MPCGRPSFLREARCSPPSSRSSSPRRLPPPDDVGDKVGDVLLEAVSSLAGPVAAFAAAMAPSAIPIQLWRAGNQARQDAVARLLHPMHRLGPPTAWLVRIMMYVSTLWVGVVTCYMGPPLLWALLTTAPPWTS